MSPHKLFIVSVSLGLCLIPVTASAQAQENAPRFVNWFLELIYDAGDALNDQISNRDDFFENVQEFAQNLGGQLEGFLDTSAGYIKDYAVETDDLDQMFEAGEDLFSNFEELNNGIWDQVGDFPQLDEATRIVSPIIDNAVSNFKSTLPPIREGDPNHPFGKWQAFYDDVGQQNPQDLAPLFQRESIDGRQQKFYHANIRETTSGTSGKDIFKRSETTEKFIDDELVFREEIINNQPDEFFKKVEDFSDFHGAKDKLIQSGTDNRIVKFFQDQINYINSLLDKFRQEEGLVIDPNHPQLAYPEGYTKDYFIGNFTNTLESLRPEDDEDNNP